MYCIQIKYVARIIRKAGQVISVISEVRNNREMMELLLLKVGKAGLLLSTLLLPLL